MAVDIVARGMITNYTAGTNINFTENTDGTIEISASGSVSSNDSVARGAINNHKSDTNNPHSVTSEQVGLGNVDNTSDIDKPVSTAMQQALDNKADSSHTHSDYALKSKYGDTTINVGRKAGTDVGTCSTAEGISTTASGISSHAEGYESIASKYASHAEGGYTTANGTNGSHAEGWVTIASGASSHAEGIATTASGQNAHAEGSSTNKILDVIPDFSSSTSDDDIITAWDNEKNFSLAKGFSSHSEGANTLAIGDYSHAEGQNTLAIGNSSHTGGFCTKALKECEFAHGKFNQSNDDTLYSIGDGTADHARHNAFEITTTGGKLHDNDIATTNNISNPNLLINPDFKINQRGMSRYDVIYKSDGTVIRPYTVDRWRIMEGTANITDGKFVLNGTIIQVIENNIGADFTASVSDSNGSATATYDDTTKTFTIKGVNATLNWAKLEIGNSATPFSPPDITTELLKCQRYYQVHNLARQRVWYYTADTLVFLLSNKVPMREGRTAEIHGTLGIVALDNKSQSGFNFVIEWATADGVKVRAEKTAHGLTDAILYVNGLPSSGRIDIDAEIY